MQAARLAVVVLSLMMLGGAGVLVNMCSPYWGEISPQSRRGILHVLLIVAAYCLSFGVLGALLQAAL